MLEIKRQILNFFTVLNLLNKTQLRVDKSKLLCFPFNLVERSKLIRLSL